MGGRPAVRAADMATYGLGVNLGGWLAIEPWMFDVAPFPGTNSEADLMLRLRLSDSWRDLGFQNADDFAVQTMRNHWEQFIPDSALELLPGMGVSHVRIPVPYSIVDAPVTAIQGSVRPGNATFLDYGLQHEGFATGGWNSFKRVIRTLKRLGVRAAVDLHTLPGCLLYTSPSPRDRQKSRMPSSA